MKDFCTSDLSAITGKRVLVTGHTGFKGSWLTMVLHSMGAEVMGYSLQPNTEPAMFDVVNVSQYCHSVIGNILDKDKLEQTFADFMPDVVFHLAAQPIVRTSYNIPVETFEVNTLGTLNVLEAIRKQNNACVGIMITTDKVYLNNETGQAYKESDPFGGYDPYSASKAAAEIVIDSYRNSFFNPEKYSEHKKSIASVRAGNVIGGGDWAADRLVPDIARALSANKAINIRNPKSVRPWQHVLEPLFGYITLAAKILQSPTLYNEGFNFGPNPNDVITVGEMAQMGIDIWGQGILEFPQMTNQPHEANLLSLDISKAAKVLEWRPLMNAKSALEMTIKWYKAYYDGCDMNAFTLKQIEEYCNLR